MFWGNRSKRSKEALKDRLELVLAYDRAQIPPGKVDALRRDLMEVVERYFPTQGRFGPNVEVEQRGDTVVLVANIPLNGN
ncbi:cell division topological specificity factor MinE [Deinococcus peraridilitoris]|uniref:Cell division topological specificity factor MinE n=1 Tax=Deinococcus peraridilitoris (strain DSM 19664 / LMG 22246 / CIP 109416 / KR-200) TaxID=937777 RepID=K9ZWX5_DEIPD|nr:cell division topological specificity factor MinE [Deinococcus peraridilitoris]AFZ66133.1 cell division topological specificity factor MinE [Deinococcus peraridilitoris DSM 19664]